MVVDLKRAWQRGAEDNIGIVAAGIAHYALLALVPALAALVLSYGLIAEPSTVAGHVTVLAEKLPPSAAELIASQLESVASGAAGAQGLGLAASLGIALFGARNGARSLMTGLNIVFHADEPRGFIKANLVAVAITGAGLSGLIMAGIGSAALASLDGAIGGIASLAFLFAIAVLGAGLLYRFAPNAPRPPWAAIWPGAFVFAVCWLAATGAFAFYAANFGSYNATYGALGAVLALITWFWATGFLLLFGALIAALRDSSN
ncbi:YihY/virulence factor BrkB family protein [Erythrobacter sp. AP23]|uniref:YihY/virulence factor BrkB family protein n=1 Tax=Erythrobacter sp. AP23 TaxID=499656 RepID=UPI00076D5A42|nr:YihY/virulence factor BrkB family protein [Erythrobacter sp. AP23]KWV94820.1 hypothetical protein ASS64_06335 [Erythrobacter sp. AP23]